MAMLTGPTRLSWNANTEPDLAGYKIYIGRASGTYTDPRSPIDVGNVTTYVIDISESGTWYFSLTAYNAGGSESGFSSELVGVFENPKYHAASSRPIYRLNHR